jgi:hypothetical protein
VIQDPTIRFPFGFDFGQRVASTMTGDVGGAKQHPFDQAHHRVSQ